jgi:hypothetical protein
MSTAGAERNWSGDRSFVAVVASTDRPARLHSGGGTGGDVKLAQDVFDVSTTVDSKITNESAI